MEKIKNVWCIEGIGFDCNSYLIDNIIVDTGTGQNKDYLYSQLESIDYNPKDIEMIVNTHCHYDHAGGNFLFPDAKVAIHQDDALAIEDENDPLTAAIFGTSMERHDVDIKLKEKDKVGDFKVIHTPGHTAGGICLWNGDILISGDTVFSDGGFGRIDLGGNREDMKKSLKRLQELDVNYLLPGHGPWVDNGKAHIELANRMFSTF